MTQAKSMLRDGARFWPICGHLAVRFVGRLTDRVTLAGSSTFFGAMAISTARPIFAPGAVAQPPAGLSTRSTMRTSTRP
jgi:hypothetical protein